MIKLKCKNILGLLGSLTFVSNSLAHEVKIHFDHQESFYTSPIIYLTGIGGQNPKIAMNNGIPTTGGVDEKEENFSKFNFISFQTDTIIDITDLKIIPITSEENPFCKQLKLSLYSSSEGNKILLPSTFFGLTSRP